MKLPPSYVTSSESPNLRTPEHTSAVINLESSCSVKIKVTLSI